jgi:hypothetical protein
MKLRRSASWISLLAAGQLLVASTARAQAPAATPPAAQEAAPAPQPYPPPAYPPPQAYPPPRSAYPPAAAYPPPSGYQLQLVAGPLVRLSSDNPRARLQMIQHLKWRDICMSPCGVRVDPNGTYRIGGGTIRPSEDFSMPRSSGNVSIAAQTGSTVKHWVGVGMTIGGGVAAGFGGLMLALSQDASSSSDPYGNDFEDIALIYGVGYLVTGVILLAIGIPLATSSTSVQVQ